MLDRREIRENPDAVKDAVRKKGIDLDVDELLDLDRAARKLQHELDQAQARRKSSAKEFAQADDARRAELRAEHAELEAQLKELREQLAETTEKLNGLLLLTPTIPWEGAPVGPGRVRQRGHPDRGHPAGVRLQAAGPRRAAGKARLGGLHPGPQGGRASAPTR